MMSEKNQKGNPTQKHNSYQPNADLKPNSESQLDGHLSTTPPSSTSSWKHHLSFLSSKSDTLSEAKGKEKEEDRERARAREREREKKGDQSDQEEDCDSHPNSNSSYNSTKPGRLGLFKKIGNGIHSLSTRYNHRRNASETFKQMRAKQGESVQPVLGQSDDKRGKKSGHDPLQSSATDKVSDKKMEDQDQDPDLDLHLDTPIHPHPTTSTSSLRENIPPFKDQDQNQNQNQNRSDSSLVPKMDSSAPVRQVPSNLVSDSATLSQDSSCQCQCQSQSQSQLQTAPSQDASPKKEETITIAKELHQSSKDEIPSKVSIGEASCPRETIPTSPDQNQDQDEPASPNPGNSTQIQTAPSSFSSSCTTDDLSTPSSNLINVHRALENGEVMLKVTPKKVMKRIFKIDPDRGQILWDSKKKNRVDLESIREVRVGSSASSYRVSLSISATHEPRWLSIIYQTQGRYKALHLIALTDDSLIRWKETLSVLQGLRRSLMGGLGLIEQRQEVWLRQHWKESDSSQDEKLDFQEISMLCKRLGIESSRKELRNRFIQADEHNRGYLDFKDFTKFVKLLKKREELEEIFESIADVWVELENVVEVGNGREKKIEKVSSSSSSSGMKVDEKTQDSDGLEASNRSHDEGSMPIPVQSTQSSTKVRGITRNRFEEFLLEEQMMTLLCSEEISKVFQKHETPSNSILSISTRQDPNRQKEVETLPIQSALLFDGFSAFLISADNSILLDQSPLVLNQKQGGNSTSKSRAEDSAIQSKSTTPANYSNAKPRANAETTEELLAASAPRQAPIHHDMTRPLSEYFISSSHNTYLVGGQWKGDSTVEGYVRALQQGARSVELDCWDGPNLTPQITHGRTLTSKVPFVDVISAIANYAFIASPYPLILSLEVHNDLQQQDVMAKILREKFANTLLTEKLKDLKDDRLPSPQDLKGKVLIKTKNLYVAEEEKRRKERSQEEQDHAIVAEGQSTATDTTESDGDGLFANARDLVRQVTKRSNHSSSTSKDSTGTGSKVLMSSDLASLLVYTVGVKHRGLNKKENYAIEHMISLSEKSAFKYIRDENSTEDLIKHNRNHLTRVYPSMSSLARLHASANFSPHHVWAAGCQLVALNWQTLDLGFEINQSIFNRNGKCGYVLKPEALRIKEVSKNSGEKIRLAIDVTIISAQQLPRFRDSSKDRDGEETDSIDPFVAVSIQTPQGWGPQPSSSGENSGNLFTPALASSASRDSLLNTSGSHTNTPVIGTPPGRVSAQNSPSPNARQLRLPSGGSATSLGFGGKTRSNASTSSNSVGLFHTTVSPSSSTTSSSAPISIPGSGPSTQTQPQTQDQLNNMMINPNSLTIPPSSPIPTPSASLSLGLSSSPPSFPGANTLRRNFSSSSLSSSTSSRNSTQLNQRTSRMRTRAIKGNGFNPIWKQKITIYLDVPAGEKTLNHLNELEKERSKSQAKFKSNLHPPSQMDQNQNQDQNQDQERNRDSGSKVGASKEFKPEQIQSLCRGLLDLCFLRFEVADDEESSSSSSSSSSTTPTTTSTTKHSERDMNSSSSSTSGNNPPSSNTTSSSSSSSEGRCIAACTICLGSMQQGYRHVPLYDSQLSQYLFSTLFVHTKIRFVGLSGGTNSSSKKSK